MGKRKFIGARYPRYPYEIGTRFSLFKHHPPPIGSTYSLRHRREVSERDLDKKNKLDVCLENPPTPGPVPDGTDEVVFETTSHLQAGYDVGAHVFIGKTIFPEGEQTLVAKFYDPLYYLANQDDRYWTSIDYTHTAERHYTRETVAYEELSSVLGGSKIPEYHGSWTCNVPCDMENSLGAKVRPVRLILMEYIEGSSLAKMDPKEFDDKERIDIVATAMETASLILHHGVQLRCPEARNIIYSRSKTDGERRIVVIDLDKAVVPRLIGVSASKDDNRLPKTPIELYFYDLGNFQDLGWLPTNNKMWMWDRWHGNGRFAPETGLYERSEFEEAPPASFQGGFF